MQTWTGRLVAVVAALAAGALLTGALGGWDEVMLLAVTVGALATSVLTVFA